MTAVSAIVVEARCVGVLRDGIPHVDEWRVEEHQGCHMYELRIITYSSQFFSTRHRDHTRVIACTLP